MKMKGKKPWGFIVPKSIVSNLFENGWKCISKLTMNFNLFTWILSLGLTQLIK
jgi:hypothetical protein